MKRKLRTLISWLLVSLMLQFTFYYFLNNQIEKVMAPTVNEPIVVKNLEADIPGTNLEGIQISYAKDYLAYKENGVLKVYNLKQKKVVFEKKPLAGSDKNMGVLYYQWLPDRDTLVYFFARKNPNPYTDVVVPVTPDATQKSTAQGTSAQSASNTKASTTTKKTTTGSSGVKTQSFQTMTTATTAPVTAPTTKNQEPEKVEDPNQSKTEPETQKPETPKPQTKVERRYNNPQITELFTLELPQSDEEGAEPDDRFNRSIDSFPAGGEITQMVVSTFTNLMYLNIKGANPQLMEIDIMKNVRTLNRSGEVISQMAASDKFGTLYVKSKSGKAEQILGLQGWDREIISNDSNDVILGDRSGTLYIGKVQNDSLVNIRSASDTKDEKNLDVKTVWEGSIPYKNAKGVIIGAKNEIIIYDDKNAYIIESGKEKTINLSGDGNIISPDGVELVQLQKIGMSTNIKLQPLQ